MPVRRSYLFRNGVVFPPVLIALSLPIPSYWNQINHHSPRVDKRDFLGVKRWKLELFFVWMSSPLFLYLFSSLSEISPLTQRAEISKICPSSCFSLSLTLGLSLPEEYAIHFSCIALSSSFFLQKHKVSPQRQMEADLPMRTVCRSFIINDVSPRFFCRYWN